MFYPVPCKQYETLFRMRKNFCQMFGYASAVGDSNFDYINVKLMKLNRLVIRNELNFLSNS